MKMLRFSWWGEPRWGHVCLVAPDAGDALAADLGSRLEPLSSRIWKWVEYGFREYGLKHRAQ